MFFPLPHPFQEFLAAQIMARHFLRIKLTFHHDLRCDAGVVGAGNPGSVVAAHAVVACQPIHDGLVECMAHVQRTGHIGRRQLDAECWFVSIGGRGVITALFPLGAPVFFDVGRVERLC